MEAVFRHRLYAARENLVTEAAVLLTLEEQ